MDKGRIIINSDTELNKVSKYIYSGFLEHIGRCIYDGIWVGEDSSIPNDGGLRIDTLDALAEVAPASMRWPGGNFAEYYHWRDGIGPLKGRPMRYNIEWGIPEDNAFGTHEFMRFCEAIGSEPHLVLNVASGSVQEARDWIEYCNSDHDSEIVRLRKENGLDDPWKVKFWEVGNESWHSGGQMRALDYVGAYRRYSNKLRWIGSGDRDKPSEVNLVACGSCLLYQDWDAEFLRGMKEMPNMLRMVDYLSDHIYSGRDLVDGDFPDEDYYKLIADLDVLDAELARATGLAKAYSSERHPIGIALGEWGAWYKGVWIDNDFVQKNTLRDAIFTALGFHLFHNYSDNLFMTNMSMTVNALQSLIQTFGPQVIRTPTYHVYRMFRPHRDGYTLWCKSESPMLSIGDGDPHSALSFSATKALDGRSIFLSVVNIDLSRPIEVDLTITGEFKVNEVNVDRLTSADIRDFNSKRDSEKVSPTSLSVTLGENRLKTILPAKSITTFEIKGEGGAPVDSEDAKDRAELERLTREESQSEVKV